MDDWSPRELKKLYRLAAKEDDSYLLKIIENASQTNNYNLIEQLMYFSSIKGQSDIVRLLLTKKTNYIICRKSMYMAYRSGYIDIVKMFIDSGTNYSNVLYRAIQDKNIFSITSIINHVTKEGNPLNSHSFFIHEIAEMYPLICKSEMHSYLNLIRLLRSKYGQNVFDKHHDLMFALKKLTFLTGLHARCGKNSVVQYLNTDSIKHIFEFCEIAYSDRKCETSEYTNENSNLISLLKRTSINRRVDKSFLDTVTKLIEKSYPIAYIQLWGKPLLYVIVKAIISSKSINLKIQGLNVVHNLLELGADPDDAIFNGTSAAIIAYLSNDSSLKNTINIHRIEPLVLAGCHVIKYGDLKHLPYDELRCPIGGKLEHIRRDWKHKVLMARDKTGKTILHLAAENCQMHKQLDVSFSGNDLLAFFQRFYSSNAYISDFKSAFYSTDNVDGVSVLDILAKKDPEMRTPVFEALCQMIDRINSIPDTAPAGVDTKQHINIPAYAQNLRDAIPNESEVREVIHMLFLSSLSVDNIIDIINYSDTTDKISPMQQASILNSVEIINLFLNPEQVVNSEDRPEDWLDISESDTQSTLSYEEDTESIDSMSDKGKEVDPSIYGENKHLELEEDQKYIIIETGCEKVYDAIPQRRSKKNIPIPSASTAVSHRMNVLNRNDKRKHVTDYEIRKQSHLMKPLCENQPELSTGKEKAKNPSFMCSIV